MRDFLPPAVVFALAVSLCFFCFSEIVEFSSELSKRIDKINETDFFSESTIEALNSAENYFFSRKALCSIIVNHDILEDIETAFKRARTLADVKNADLFSLELCALKTILEDMSEEQNAVLENVF